jgi:uracil-DNA glycosylase
MPPPRAPIPVARPSAPAVPVRTAIPTFANVQELSAHAQACTRCVLHGRRRSVSATGGPETSSWAVLTLYAWGEDATRGGVLSGDYAKPLLELSRSLGLPEPAVAAIFACTPDDPSDTTIQGFTEAVRCRGHWLQRLKLSGARAVLVLDHKATSLARGPSASVDWPAFRGRVWDLDGLPAVSTHHPSRLARQEALRPEVDADLRQILSLIGTA